MSVDRTPGAGFPLERRLPTLSLTDYVAAVHEAEPDTDHVAAANKDEDG
jgi:hypothetical protein